MFDIYPIVMQLTQVLAHGKNIPNVNTPSMGPPTMPCIVRAA